MQGMDENTGKHLSGEEHLRQSIKRIIMTPLGTHPLQREFGSRVPYLVDQPMTDETALQVNTAIIEALYKFEPRIETLEAQLDTENLSNGELNFTLKCVYQGQEVTLDGIPIQ